MSAGKGEEGKKWSCCAVKQLQFYHDSPAVSGGEGVEEGRDVGAPESGNTESGRLVACREEGYIRYTKI